MHTVDDPPIRVLKVWRCRALDRRTGEVLKEVDVEAYTRNHARRLARGRLPNYARIVCEELHPAATE